MTSRRAGRVQSVRAQSDLGRGRWWLALIGLCVVLTVPLFVVDVPPLGDYPNHLARVFVLASLPHDDVLARFYAANWSVIPNLALDLIAPPLINVLPVHVVGRLLIAAAVLLPVLGTVAYNTALGGRWWSLGAGLIAYNSCLLYGFLNFEISVGVALLLAAVWLRWREPRPVQAIAVAAIGAPILFACHLMGLAFFAVLIGGAELFQLYRLWISNERTGDKRTGPTRTGPERTGPARTGPARTGNLWFAALGRGAVLLLVFAIPFGLYAMSALRQHGGNVWFLPFGAKLLQFLTAFVNYDWTLDMTTAVVAIVLPAAGVLLRRGRAPGPAAIAMVLLLILFLAAPYAWKGTFSLDTRFAIMLGFMLFAGFVPTCWPTGFRRCAAGAMVLLFVARMVLLTTAWAAHETDLADLRTVLAPVQPGQAVYVAEAGLKEAPSYWAANPHWRLLSNGLRVDEHLGALVLIEHRAFWPLEFDNPSQQPMQTREPYQTLAARVGGLPDRSEAAVADVCGFDYVVLTGADAVPDLPADRFRMMVRSGFAALYAIVRCSAPVLPSPVLPSPVLPS